MTTLTAAEPQAATTPARPSRMRRALPWLVAAVLVGGFATCGWLLYREFDGVIDARPLGYAALFAFVPVLPLGGLLWWLNRDNPEPWWTLAVALFWGGLVAALLSLHLNEWLAGLVGDEASASARGAVFVAPWTEEVTKGAIVFALVIWRRHLFNGVVAGVVLGGLAGLGFAFTENILYYGQYLQLQRDELFTWSGGFDQLFLWRGVRAAFVHPMFTMCTGFGVGLVVRYRNVGVRILGPAVGFTVAALLHMGYNSVASLADSADALTAAYVGILLPTLAVTILVVLLARRSERRAVAARLHDYTAYGWIKAGHIPFIVERRPRRALRREARRLGKPHRRTVRQFQRCGIQLGVLRDRMVRGVAGASERRNERELVDRFRHLRAKVVLPGSAGHDPRRSTSAVSSW